MDGPSTGPSAGAPLPRSPSTGLCPWMAHAGPIDGLAPMPPDKADRPTQRAGQSRAASPSQSGRLNIPTSVETVTSPATYGPSPPMRAAST